MLVSAELAMFAAELEGAFNDVYNRYVGKLDNYFPLGLELHTCNGLTVRFLDEGLDFYPEARVQ